MSTGWDRINTFRDRGTEVYERVEYVRFLDSSNVTHTCKPSLQHAVSVELVSICGRINIPDIIITGGVNDTLTFLDNSSAPFVVTIPAGTYTYVGLGAILEGLIEAATPGTEKWDGSGFDAVSSRFVFVATKAFAGLWFGSSLQATAAATLGFPNQDAVNPPNVPHYGAVLGLNRSHCYHLTSDVLGRGRRWGVNDSDGPTGSLMWTFPSADAVDAVAKVTHYPPNLVAFAWGSTSDVKEFDLKVTCDSDYLLTGSTAPCVEATFTGVACLRFIIQRYPELYGRC